MPQSFKKLCATEAERRYTEKRETEQQIPRSPTQVGPLGM